MSNWSALDIPGVEPVIKSVSRKIANSLRIEYEDALQVARILTAENFGNLSNRMEGECFTLGTFHHELWCDLFNYFSPVQKQRQGAVSLDEGMSEVGDAFAHPPWVGSIDHGDTYSRSEVETLLPAIWDKEVAYGLRWSSATPRDMPRASRNPAHGNLLPALLADVRAAWRHAAVTPRQRQALFLIFGLDWTQRDSAALMGVSQPAMSGLVRRGIDALLQCLNPLSHSSGAQTLSAEAPPLGIADTHAKTKANATPRYGSPVLAG